jgi:tetratricopeptide (TPR) repeat protein
LGLQIKRAGLKSYIVPTTAYGHEWSGSIRSMKEINFYDKSETPEQIVERNKKLFLEKWEKIEKEEDREILLISLWIEHILAVAKQLIDDNQLEKAVDIFTKIKNAYPKLPIAHINLGIISFFEKNYSEAEKHFEEALKLNPDDQTAINYLKKIKGKTA